MDSEANPRYIAFDAVEIDLIGRRVRVAGVDTALEPKAFDVLALLAQEPGKAFTRDDIFDAVWGHRHVTPGVLNRAILLIRQVLGDSAQTLRTLYGIGYRFDGEARFFSRREPINPAVPVAGDTQDAVAPAQSAVVPFAAPVADVVPTAPIDPQPNPQLTAAAMAAPTVVRPALRWRFLPFVAVFAALAAGVLLWHARDRETTTAPSASPTLVVLPLHAIGGDKNESVFAEGLSEELTTQLAHIEGLRLISSTSAARAQKEGFDAAQLTERLHVTHALEGSLREVGDQLRIDVRLVETPSGRTVWAQDFDRKSGEVFAVQQDITQAVAAALALRIGLVQSATKAPDPQVYREYLRLRHIFSAANDEAPVADAQKDLHALVARAPDFAAAHGLLALNFAAEMEGEGKDEEALREVQRTLALDPDNADAHAALAEIEFRTRNWAVADKELHAALAAQPQDVILQMVTGMWLSRLGYGERAISHFRIAYAADPLGYWAVYNLATELDTVGKHDEAKPYLDALPDLEMVHEGYAHTAAARWWNAVWRHDLSSARDFAARLPERNGLKKAYVTVTRALADSSLWPDAEAAVAERERMNGAPPQIKLLLPQFQAAPILAQYEDGSQEPGGKLIWAVEFVSLRRDPAFQDFIKRMKFIDFWKTNGWPPQCKPDGDGARCD
jgi:TolB-like protein/DNA-binding winged helix-turn-helix (wHTH) protein/Tfp pilus assembly protein PilF